jgi:hypothetical protein
MTTLILVALITAMAGGTLGAMVMACMNAASER